MFRKRFYPCMAEIHFNRMLDTLPNSFSWKVLETNLSNERRTTISW